MKEIELKITAQSPLAIGQKKFGSIYEARDFIPGSVIRGAIASFLVDPETEEQSEDFNNLFLADKAAIFCHAYPALHLLPATALSSKTKSGFKSTKNNVSVQGGS
jgi:CRISPR-associated protein Csx10